MSFLDHAIDYIFDVDCAAVTHIDSSAVQALKQLHEEYKSRNIQVFQTSNNEWFL